jgi:SPP1 family predicted phage head-tail adaptor
MLFSRSVGSLSERIAIQEKYVSRDDLGAEVITWVEIAEVWASAEPIRGREYVALRAAQADITTRFVIRHRSGLTPAMRVQWGDAYYDIIEVIDVHGRHRWLELMCIAQAVAT